MALWVKATKERFESEEQFLDQERQLSDGEYIKHFELMTPDAEAFFLRIRSKTSFKIYSEEEMQAILAGEPCEEV